MQRLTIVDSVVDWAIDHPEIVQIFEKYGIDYSCSGKSLEYACEKIGVNQQQVLNEFIASIAAKRMT